jgi:hypothetical protein
MFGASTHFLSQNLSMLFRAVIRLHRTDSFANQCSQGYSENTYKFEGTLLSV